MTFRYIVGLRVQDTLTDISVIQLDDTVQTLMIPSMTVSEAYHLHAQLTNVLDMVGAFKPLETKPQCRCINSGKPGHTHSRGGADARGLE